MANERGSDQGSTRLLVRLVARAVLACLGSLVLWSALPLLAGWHPSVVMSGSMRPALQPGDVVVVRKVPVADLRVHQVLLVPDPDHAGRLRLHRLEQIRPHGVLSLRGDANPAADSSPVRAHDVIGVGALRVPLVGLPAKALRDGQRLRVAVMLAVFAVLLLLARDRPPRSGAGRPPEVPRSGGEPGRSHHQVRDGRVREAHVLARRTAVLAVAVPLLAFTGPGGFARFAIAATNSTNQFSAAASFYPYRDAVLADSPVLYWRLGEASGTTAANSAASGPTGTYYGTPALGQASSLTSEVVNKSISTATSGSVTAATAVTPSAQFTVEAWIKTSSTSGGRIFGFGNRGATTLSTTADRQLYLSPTGKVVAGIRNALLANTVATSPLSYNDGQWHHVAATYNASTLLLYVDGTQVASKATTTAATFSGYWRAGMESLSAWPTPPSGNAYAGGLDELAVYGTALSATRIRAHYVAATT